MSIARSWSWRSPLVVRDHASPPGLDVGLGLHQHHLVTEAVSVAEHPELAGGQRLRGVADEQHELRESHRAVRRRRMAGVQPADARAVDDGSARATGAGGGASPRSRGCHAGSPGLPCSVPNSATRARSIGSVVVAVLLPGRRSAPQRSARHRDGSSSARRSTRRPPPRRSRCRAVRSPVCSCPA